MKAHHSKYLNFNITGQVTWIYDVGSGSEENYWGSMYWNKNLEYNVKLVTAPFTPCSGTIGFKNICINTPDKPGVFFFQYLKLLYLIN